MVRDKEKIKAYNQTPSRKKSSRIGAWKHIGLHVDDYDELYKKYLEATHCGKCKKEFVGGKRNNSTKMADHNHNIEFNNFRGFLCHQCNCNDKTTNKSGTPNVFYHKKNGSWLYYKTVNKKTHRKYFKTKQEAIDYKEEYESQI